MLSSAGLPLPVPEPVGLGLPGCGFPRPWSVYRWLPGEPASATTVDDLEALASDVARFLSCLQAVDSRGGPPAGAHSFGRGGPLRCTTVTSRHAWTAFLLPTWTTVRRYGWRYSATDVMRNVLDDGGC